jgi:peptidyl-prolyl cis-trans isomerase B (cyclophilin B)
MAFTIVSVLLISCTTLVAQDHMPGKKIKIETSKGNMILLLYDATPVHRDNMIKLIKEGFYDGQLFHRVIKDFMIQGGDPHSIGADKGQRLGVGGPGYTIPAEIRPNLYHKKGALAAARRGDSVNPDKASSGSQFYIVQGRVLSPGILKGLEQQKAAPFSFDATEAYTTIGGTPHLDGDYTVFGELLEGFDVLDRIAASQTDSNNRPVEDVTYTISLLK